ALYITKMPWATGPNWWQYRNRKDFTFAQLETIKAQATFATAVAPMAMRPADVGFLNQQMAMVNIIATTEDYLRISGAELRGGRFLLDSDNENRKSVAVLGMDVVDGLFPDSNPIGATVKIDGRPFQVVGVLARRGKMLEMNQDLQVIIPFKT